MKVSRIQVRNAEVRLAGVAVLSRVELIGFLAGNQELCPSFDEPKFWIPQFQIFVDIPNKCQNAFTVQGPVFHIGFRPRLGLDVSVFNIQDTLEIVSHSGSASWTSMKKGPLPAAISSAGL
jgi:hypothetical protein